MGITTLPTSSSIVRAGNMTVTTRESCNGNTYSNMQSLHQQMDASGVLMAGFSFIHNPAPLSNCQQR
jgi:hypothetical protein